LTLISAHGSVHTSAPYSTLEEVRNLQSQGTSSTEVIALGYKPSTVYKAQRQLRQAPLKTNQPLAQVLVTNLGSEAWSDLRAENAHLRQQLEGLKAQVATADSLERDLERALARLEELEDQATQAQVLRERLAAIESEAQAAGELRQKLQQLQSHFSQATASLAQEAQDWQGKLGMEQIARREAEALAAGYLAEMAQLKEANQQLERALQELPGRLVAPVWQWIQPLKKELEELRSLGVWNGHPCSICGQPTSGVTSRQVAGKILERGGYVHGQCVKKDGW
jgi:DNA repair exonuclease SbcCD ATPase subunit